MVLLAMVVLVVVLAMVVLVRLVVVVPPLVVVTMLGLMLVVVVLPMVVVDTVVVRRQVSTVARCSSSFHRQTRPIPTLARPSSTDHHRTTALGSWCPLSRIAVYRLGHSGGLGKNTPSFPIESCDVEQSRRGKSRIISGLGTSRT